MEKETAQALWQRLEDAYRAQEKRWSRLSLAFGLSKLVLLVTFFLTVYFIGRAGASAWSGALAAAQAVLFAAACVVQHRLNVRMRFARAMAELAEKNGNRLTGEWRSFRDTGEELAGPEHEYARDLDIVGPGIALPVPERDGHRLRPRAVCGGSAAPRLHGGGDHKPPGGGGGAGRKAGILLPAGAAGPRGRHGGRAAARTAAPGGRRALPPRPGGRGSALPSRAPCAARCWRRPRFSAGCGRPRGVCCSSCSF